MHSKTIELDYPIKRGEQEIKEITLIKPEGTGWMRGASLMALMQMDTAALTMVLPRITQPPLTEPEIRVKLAPSDLFQIGAEVAGFLLPKSAQPSESLPE